jgi:hypothetical protein
MVRKMVDRNDKRFFDFACSCGDESQKKWEAVYEEVREELKADDRSFTTHLVFQLDNMEHGSAYIRHIYTDMWSGIAVRYQYNYKEELECEDGEENQVRECKCDTLPDYTCDWTTQDFWIECDKIHHGLARAYQLVKEFDEKQGR